MSKIDILLATYNGENFLRNQLLSIQAQTFTDWTLIVHDDGSNDRSKEILREFAERDKRIILIDDNITKLGPGGNFMHLLKFSKAPFICFADQDDIWLENKLMVCYEKISNKDNSKPQIIKSNCILWDGNHMTKNNMIIKVSIKNILFSNGGIQGCASMFNRKVLELMMRPVEFVAMHDHLMGLIGVCNNCVEYIDIPLLLYRRHTCNVTQSSRPCMSAIKHRSALLKESYYNGIKSFYYTFKDEINDNDRAIIELFLKVKNMNPVKRFISLIFIGFSINGSKMRFLFKLLLCKYFE